MDYRKGPARIRRYKVKGGPKPPQFPTPIQEAKQGLFLSPIFHDDPASLDAALDLQTARDGLVVIQRAVKTASLDVGLELQAASNCLVVLGVVATRFNPALDLQTARNRLVVIVLFVSASLNVRFDFHTSSP